MKAAMLALLFLASCAGAARFLSDEKAKTSGDMSKVVTMLEDMLKKSKDDFKADQDAYLEYKTYCEENTATKTTDISEAKLSISLLGNRIEEIQGSSGSLSVQVAKLKKDMADNKEAREQAKGLRDKQKEEYAKLKEDLTAGVAQMKEAITILSEVGGDQTAGASAANKQFMADYKEKSLVTIKASVKQALIAASYFLKPAQRKTISAFVQAPFTGTYTSQSGQVVGILKDMEETFTSNLAEAEAQDKKDEEAFQKFTKNKEEAYADMETSYNEKQGPGAGSLSTNDEDLSTKKTELTETTKTKEDDEAFLETLTVSCKKAGKGYEKHKKWAANEEIALNKAIQILTNDVATAQFAGQEATKFLQLSSTSSTRTAAAALLQKAAKSTAHAERLNKIVLLLEAGNPFTVVLEQIDKMVELADSEQKVDDAEKKWCTDTNEKNDKNLKDKEDQLSTLKGEITKLKDDISLTLESGLKFRIKKAEDQLKTNLENQGEQTKQRRDANIEYQKDLHNMENSIDTLKKATETLKEYYDSLDNEQFGLIQVGEEPKSFDKFDEKYTGGNEKGKEVITLLEGLVDATTTEANGKHSDEQSAQSDYEDSMKELTDSEEDYKESIIKFNKELTSAEKTLENKYEEQTNVEKEKISVERYIEKINGKGSGCEFILGKYDERKTLRGKEKEALEGAKTKLKGTPAFTSAQQAAKEKGFGKCKEDCNADEAGAKCKACMAGISVPGYCAGHAGAAGC